MEEEKADDRKDSLKLREAIFNVIAIYAKRANR